MKKLSPKSVKIIKTCNLYLCFLTLGMCMAVPGPCLLDLQNLVKTDTQHIAFIYTARSVGYLLGSLVGGILLDTMKSKQAVLIVCNFFVAASALGIPWSKNLGTLTGFMIANGLSLGAVDTGGNVVCLTLWGGDSGPFYQALHFTFGLGGLISPLIAAPFLGDYSSEASSSINENNITFTSNFTAELLYENSNFTSETENETKILFPFSIIGAFGLFVTMLFLIVCFVAPEEDSKTERENEQNVKKSFTFLFSVIFLNFLLLFVETGTEIGYAQMLTTYAVKGPLKLTPSIGSFMTSTFWAAFTISRLASIFLAIKLSNLTLIVCDLVITSAGAVVLLFFTSYEWSLWLSSVLLGMGIASFFPAAVGWLDTYINVTNKMASIFTVGAAFGEMVIPFTITYFIETVPKVLIYVVPASCVLAVIIVLILYMILRNTDKKDLDLKDSQESSGSVEKNSSINT